MKLRNKILRRAAAQENRSANRPAQPRGKATATAAAQPPPEPSSLTPELDGSTPPDDDAADALLALGAPQAPPVRQQQPQPQRHAAAPQPPQRHAAAPQPAPIYDAAAAAWLGANGLSPLLDLGALRLGLATPRTAGATPHLARLSSTATLELARTPLPHDERFPAQPTRPDFGQHPAAAEALACQLVSPASLPRMPLRPAARPAPAGQEPGQHPAPPMVRVVLPPPPSGPLPTSSDILLYAHPALVPDLGLPAVVWGQPWPGPRSVVALAAAAAAAPSPATGAGATRTAAIRAASSYGSFEPSPPGSLVSPHTQYWPPPAVDSSGGLTRDRSRRQRRQRTHSPSFHEWSDDEEAPAEAARSRSRRRRADSTSDEEMEFLNCTGSDSDDSDSDASAASRWSTGSRRVASSQAMPPASARGGASGGDDKPAPRVRARKRKAPGGGAGLKQAVGQAVLKRQIEELMQKDIVAPKAAALMGCSATTFRKLCRSVGIPRWPTRTGCGGGSDTDSE